MRNTPQTAGPSSIVIDHTSSASSSTHINLNSTSRSTAAAARIHINANQIVLPDQTINAHSKSNRTDNKYNNLSTRPTRHATRSSEGSRLPPPILLHPTIRPYPRCTLLLPITTTSLPTRSNSSDSRMLVDRVKFDLISGELERSWRLRERYFVWWWVKTQVGDLIGLGECGL